MIRFQPDTWLDGFLRPFLLADPSAGLYYEEAAPDWRFAALLLGALGLAIAGRWRSSLSPLVRGSLLALLTLFYVWTFVIGNGRYFMPGLLLVGPLLVAVWHGMPGSRTFRWTALLGLVVLQTFTLAAMYRPGAWGLVRWTQGPAIALQASPLRERPQVVVTISAISYSALVPFFHPESRWVNLAGQIPLHPGISEFSRVKALLSGPLPISLLVPANAVSSEPGTPASPDQPTWAMIDESIAEHGLVSVSRVCESLRTNLLPHGAADPGSANVVGAFWLCPLELRPEIAKAAAKGWSDPYSDVFDRVEAACPRYFPPGASRTRAYTGFWQRYYLGSDMRLIVDGSGNVLYRYFRHFTPVKIGSVSEVRRGDWQIVCKRLQGRYQPPWAGD